MYFAAKPPPVSHFGQISIEGMLMWPRPPGVGGFAAFYMAGGWCCRRGGVGGAGSGLPARGGWWRGLGVAGAGGFEARARGLRELLDNAQASGSIT